MFKKTYNSKIDFLNSENVKGFQLIKVKETIQYAYKNSKFYRNLFKKLNISPNDIRVLGDIEKIPITTKEDLRKKNWDFVAAPRSSWVDCFSTSGTTGEPIFLPCVIEDLERIAMLTAKSFKVAGVKKGDVIQMTLPMSTAMWIAGLGFWLGNIVNGNCTLRIGPGFVDSQIKIMQLLRPTIVIGVPSFLIKLAYAARKVKDFKKIKPRLILITAENIIKEDFNRNALGKQLGDIWDGVAIRSGFGSNEMEAVGFECDQEHGHHMSSEAIFFEVVDPNTHRVLKDGEKGMLVITHLGVKGMPLIRYSQGDITFKISQRCRCGRTSNRIGPILGRIDQQIKIKGVNIYPSAIEEILLDFSEIGQYYIEVSSDGHFRDRISIYFSIEERSRCYSKDLIYKIKDRIRSMFGVGVDVFMRKSQEILKQTMPSDSRKPKRFFDMRKRG